MLLAFLVVPFVVVVHRVFVVVVALVIDIVVYIADDNAVEVALFARVIVEPIVCRVLP